MPTLTYLAAYVWRKYALGGVSASGFNKPDPDVIVRWGTEIEDGLGEVENRVDLLETTLTTGKRYLSPVRGATGGNVVLAGGLVDGVTAGGITFATNDSIALFGQTDATENGIYLVPASGTASRRTDADTAEELLGATVFVREGTYAGRTITCQPASLPIVVGTTALSWVLTSDAAAQATPQRIGAPATPVTGTGATPNAVFIYAEPFAVDGYMSEFGLYALATGSIRIRRWTKSGDVFTAVGPAIDLAVSSGLNVFRYSDGTLPYLAVEAGEMPGMFSRTQILPYIAGAAPSGGWYGSGGVGGDVTEFTDSTVSATNAMQFYAVISGDGETVKAAQLSGLSEAQDYGYQYAGLLGDITPSNASGLSVAANTFAFRNPMISSGFVEQITAYVTTAGLFKIKRFVSSGDTHVQSGPDYFIEFATTGIVTLTEADFDPIPVLAGEVMGFFPTTGRVAYLSGSNIDLAPADYWVSAVGQDSSSFIDASYSQVAVQIGFKVRLSTVESHERRLSALEQQTDAIQEEGSYYEAIVAAEASISDLSVTFSGTIRRDGNEASLVSSTVAFDDVSASGRLRYDYVYVDAYTGEFEVIDGTERGNDPTPGAPDFADASQIPAFIVRVAYGAVTSVVPIWRGLDGNDRRILPDLQASRARAKRLLPNLMDKIAAKSAIRILGFGDSITAIQSDGPDFSDPLNGALRDRGAASGTPNTYLRDNYASGVVDALPLFTSVQLGRSNDGAGTVHTKVGWNWELVAEFVRRGWVLGTDLHYDNGGKGGTATDDAVDNTTLVPTTWLNTALASTADVVSLCLGMNELGNVGMERRLTAIVQEFQDAGIEVLLHDCPRPRNASYVSWMTTCRAIQRVSRFTNCAHVPFSALEQTDYFHSMMMAPDDVCEASAGNHPGLKEFEIFGAEIIRTLF